MCGCGILSLRYPVEVDADFVLENDANDHQRKVILSNLSQIPRFAVEVDDATRRWNLTHYDANKVMAKCYLHTDFFDLIDVDSFGSDSSFLRSAFNALKLGWLVYVSSTYGFSFGGHGPHKWRCKGSFCNGIPCYATFSYYSYHGPVFRVMLRLRRGRTPYIRHYGFISYCFKCGNLQSHSWDKLGKIRSPCSEGKVLFIWLTH